MESQEAALEERGGWREWLVELNIKTVQVFCSIISIYLQDIRAILVQMDLVADRCQLVPALSDHTCILACNISSFPQILYYYYCSFLFLTDFDFTVTAEMQLDNCRTVSCFAWPGVVMIFPSERKLSPAYEKRNRRSLAEKAWLWTGCLWTSYWKRQRVRAKPVKFPLVHGPLSPIGRVVR